MGRPRQFDEEELLEKVTEVFWRKGFHNTSTSDLEAATGLMRGSLYNAFADKRGLYLAALDHYSKREMGGAVSLIGRHRPAAKAVAALLRRVIEQAGPQGERRGCLICDAAVDLAPGDAEIGGKVRAAFDPLRNALIAMFQADEPAIALKEAMRRADHVAATYLGLRVFAKAGYPVTALRNIASQAVADVTTVQAE